jgi:hypothetical protein
MHVFQTQNDTRYKELSLIFSESLFLTHVISEITTIDIVSDNVKVLSVLEGKVNIDKKGVFQLGQ